MAITVRAVLNNPNSASEFSNFQNFGNRKEPFFQSISKTLEATGALKSGDVNFQNFRPFPNLCSTDTQGRHKGVVRRTTSRTQKAEVAWILAGP